MNPGRIGLLLLAAALCASCESVVPSPPAVRETQSPSTTDGTTATPRVAVASPPAAPPPASPAATPPASPAATPPYNIRLDEPIAQEPGTVVFGELEGPDSDIWLTAYLPWPDKGYPYDWQYAYGAFWGEPVEASTIRITLYRITDGTLRLVWSDTKPVVPEATGYLDDLVPFKGPGTYRLEVTRGSELLAWVVARMAPRCDQNCSGG
jgi:hypothetical protein